MRKSKTDIILTMEEKHKLGSVSKARTAPFRAVQRARLVLLVSKGVDNKAIARKIGLWCSMVMQWRQPFAEARIEGLEDVPRFGRRPKYDKNTKRRILALLATDHPTVYSSWRGKLVYQTLKDVYPPPTGMASATKAWHPSSASLVCEYRS